MLQRQQDMPQYGRAGRYKMSMFEHPAGILKRKFEGFGQIFCH
jgi:hypothetical protein